MGWFGSGGNEEVMKRTFIKREKKFRGERRKIGHKVLTSNSRKEFLITKNSRLLL